MKIDIYHRHECHLATGLCVVIDVLRAFTTAAFAFEAGAKEIVLVSTVEEAFQMQRENQSLILMGEVNGLPISGFHYGNSPAAICNQPLSGKQIVQRTSCGTQGVVNCSQAEHLLMASFVVAHATLKRILALSPKQVSFIVTGGHNGDEDLALAEYLQYKLEQREVSPSLFLDRVRFSPLGKIFTDPAVVDFPVEDLDLATQLDRFPFAMEVEKRNGRFVANKVGS